MVRFDLLRLLTALFFVSAACAGRGACAAEDTKAAVTPATGAEKATDSVAVDPAAELTVERIQARLKRIEDSSDLDAELKPKLIDLYKETIDQLKLGDEWADKAAAWQTRSKNKDPDELKRLKAQLEAPANETSDPLPSTIALAELEQKLATKEADLKKAQANLLDVDPKRRREQLPQLMSEKQKDLKEADDELAKLPPATDALDLPEANRARWAAMRRAAQEELTSYDNERIWFEANAPLVAARQDFAALKVRRAEAAVKRLRDVLNERRQQEAVRQADEARRAVMNARLPQLKRWAERNAALTQEQSGPEGFPAKSAALSKEFDDLKKTKTNLDTKFKRVKDRINAAGLTDAVGLVLQKQQRDLPDLPEHRRRLRAAKNEESHVRAKLIELEDQRAELADLEGYIARVMDTVDESISGPERAEAERTLRELLKARQTYIESQTQIANHYFDTLSMAFIKEEAALIAQVEEYKSFISERILWVRSAPVISLNDFYKAWEGLLKLADADSGLSLVRELVDDVVRTPAIYVAAALFLIPLFIGRRRLRKRIDAVDQETQQSYAADIQPTIKVSVLTGLISVIWPASIALVALRLAAPTAASLHAQTIAYGLRVTALAFLSMETVRQICRRRGLAEAHFGWPPAGLILVRRHIRWAMLLGLPLCFVVAVVEAPEFELHRSPLGRLAFMASLLVLAGFAHCVLHPTRGLLQSLTARKDVSWFWRSPRAWHLVAVATPLVLAVVAGLGYFYTALILASRLHATVWFLLGLLIVQAFAQRWLLVARRKLAIKQARDRRAAALSAQHHPTAVELAAAAAPSPVDLVTIDVQTRRLLRSSVNVALAIGCWLIWIDVLPALGILDSYELSSYWTEDPRMVNDKAEKVLTRHAVTLGDALLSGVVMLMTVVAGRNLPGLLEIAFLQRLPMDAGGRYAITTVSRYVITLVGVAVAFWMVGVSWSSIQWLVAAMTVGLGFGLQEIFANFVSGLIILFERPVRVGDVVTIGGISGAVSRIRIRATTITDGDRKELIVPNKEFITGQLINWTLTDRILRMVVRLGLAYGSDITLARQLLLKAATEDPRILREPAPTASFEQFSDSTLNFELRVFVDGLDHFADIRHDLNSRIDQYFRAAGIEMAFPQCDVHVRSLDSALSMLSRVEPLKRAS